MHIHDKIVTAICRTSDGIEWTTIKVASNETKILHQEQIQIDSDGDRLDETMASLDLPKELTENLKGDICTPIRTADLLTRIIQLPSTDPDEIEGMVPLQIDQFSPFPVDQLAFSHEIIQTNEASALVLIAIAKRSDIDAIGDLFTQQNIYIHSIDSRTLGWLKLIHDAGHIPTDQCEIILIDDGIEFSLIVTSNGLPLAVRMLPITTDDLAIEIEKEINYTLTTLDIEYDLPPPTSLQYWNTQALSDGLCSQLEKRCNLSVHHQSIDQLPPLSEGIVRRALSETSHIELIPREWIEHEKAKQLKNKTILTSSVIIIIWLLVLLGFFAIYKTRDQQLNKVKEQVETLAPAANQALGNREKLKKLKTYIDRSSSSVECLREVTQLLPKGDIEFISYKYDKNKGVTLRGTAKNDQLTTQYMKSLANSPLFDHLKDQSNTTQTKKGVRRAVFSVTLTLKTEKETS